MLPRLVCALPSVRTPFRVQQWGVLYISLGIGLFIMGRRTAESHLVSLVAHGLAAWADSGLLASGSPEVQTMMKVYFGVRILQFVLSTLAFLATPGVVVVDADAAPAAAAAVKKKRT